MNGLVKAITKHEAVLIRKTYRALRNVKSLNSNLKKKFDYVQMKVARNIKAFYLRLMIKKYKEL